MAQVETAGQSRRGRTLDLDNHIDCSASLEWKVDFSPILRTIEVGCASIAGDSDEVFDDEALPACACDRMPEHLLPGFKIKQGRRRTRSKSTSKSMWRVTAGVETSRLEANLDWLSGVAVKFASIVHSRPIVSADIRGANMGTSRSSSNPERPVTQRPATRRLLQCCCRPLKECHVQPLLLAGTWARLGLRLRFNGHEAQNSRPKCLGCDTRSSWTSAAVTKKRGYRVGRMGRAICPYGWQTDDSR